MKIQIRRNTFETNSSSMHSLVITKTPVKHLKEEGMWIYNGTLSLNPEDELSFGRSPFDILSTPFDRFRYLMALYADKPEIQDKVVEALKEVIPTVKNVVIKEDEYYEYSGSVDHQSSNLIPGFLEEYNVSFKEFIENDKYMIIIDGDEYCKWENLKEAGLIDESNIELEIDPFSDEKYEEKYIDDDYSL